MRRSEHCMTLVKGEHRFVFTYAAGRESDLLSAFVVLANDRDSGFDWFDAAALSSQIGGPVSAVAGQVVRATTGQDDD